METVNICRLAPWRWAEPNRAMFLGQITITTCRTEAHDQLSLQQLSFLFIYVFDFNYF